MQQVDSIKGVIVVGGLGTHLAEETEIKPKPVVYIGEWPILLHIMRHDAYYGFKAFFSRSPDGHWTGNEYKRSH
jgi:NDP-sugar pyrophosphorylase family protein